MPDTTKGWVGTGYEDCCRVGRSTLAKNGTIEADVRGIDPSVTERERDNRFTEG